MSEIKYKKGLILSGYPYPFKGMIFEGGGPLGVAHLGAIDVFYRLKIIDNIRYFVGSSAGSIMAACLACKADPIQLYDILYNTDFNMFKDDSPGVFFDMARFIQNFGWYKGDVLEEWFGKILHKLTGNSEITFMEAHKKYGTNLIVTVTDVNLSKTLYVTHTTYPDMKIKTAVRRSSIIPLFFRADYEDILTKVFNNGRIEKKMIRHYFTDGGLLNNYPINALNGILKENQVIGFRLMTSVENAQREHVDLQANPDPPSNVVEYIFLLCEILWNQALRLHVKESDWLRTVKIDVRDHSSTNFNVTNDDKLFLINQGKIASEKYLVKYLKQQNVLLNGPENLPLSNSYPKRSMVMYENRRSSYVSNKCKKINEQRRKTLPEFSFTQKKKRRKKIMVKKRTKIYTKKYKKKSPQ